MPRHSSTSHRSPRTLLLVMGMALTLAGCSALTLGDPPPTSGDGWELLEEVDGGPDVGPLWASRPSDPPRARAMVDQQQLEDAWDELGLAGSPPAVDHDAALAVLYSTPIGGQLEDVLLVGDQVRISFAGREVGDEPTPRTLLFGLDRDALGDVASLTWGGNPMDGQRPMATSVREEPLAFPEDRGPFEASVEDGASGRLIVVRSTADDLVAPSVPAPTDDSLAFQPDELVLWRWDGLQWRDVPDGQVVQVVPSELSDEEDVVAAVGIEPAPEPTGLLDGTYVVHVVPRGFGPSTDDEGRAQIGADPPRAVVPFEVRDGGRTIDLDP